MKGLSEAQEKKFRDLKEKMLGFEVKRAKAHVADTAHDLERWPELADDILDDFDQTVKFYEEKLIGEVRQP